MNKKRGGRKVSKKRDSVGGEIDGIFDDLTSFPFSYANLLMTGHAVSEAVKRKASRRAENARYQAAVEEYQRELQKEGKKRGVRPIAEKHGVNPRTLHRLANGGNFILASAHRALPLTRNNIIRHANAILEGKGRDSPDERVGWERCGLDVGWEAIRERRRLAEEKKAKEAAKERRNTAKNNKKERRERLEARWKEVCEEHDQAVAAWEIQQAKLRAEGIRVADLPKKPKRPLKSTVAELDNVEDEEEDEDSDVEES